LRPQLYAEIIAGREIILCENCNRILYKPAWI
jgi:predicted  nucleic acid-binding Zn-ribbon protein